MQDTTGQPLSHAHQPATFYCTAYTVTCHALALLLYSVLFPASCLAAPSAAAPSRTPKSGMPLFGVSPTGKLFSPEHPGWHDPKRAPGATPLLRDDVTGRGFHTTSGWWYPIVTLQALFLSPNLVWLAISLAMYIGVPYELEAPGGPRDGWALSWVLPRFYLNCGVTMLYVGYWYEQLVSQSACPFATPPPLVRRSTECCLPRVGVTAAPSRPLVVVLHRLQVRDALPLLLRPEEVPP
jgi:hypothetical protein